MSKFGEALPTLIDKFRTDARINRTETARRLKNNPIILVDGDETFPLSWLYHLYRGGSLEDSKAWRRQ